MDEETRALLRDLAVLIQALAATVYLIEKLEDSKKSPKGKPPKSRKRPRR